MKHAIALAAITFFAGAAQADGLYASIAGGLTKADLDCGGTTACDNSGTGLRAAFGWQANPVLAVEGLYLNLGKATATVPISGFGNVSAEFKSTFLGAAAVLRLPLSPSLDLDLRLGGGQVKTTLSLRGTGVAGSFSDDGFQPLFGLGMSYSFSPQLRLIGQWETTRSDFEGEKADVSALTVGVRWNF